MTRFLKHPLVQYIPIRVNTYSEGIWQKPLYKDPIFFVYQDLKALSVYLSQLGLPQINHTAQEEPVIIALNFKVEKIFYRFVTVKLIGLRVENYFQIFSLTKKYFTSRVIHFILLTQEGKQISWKNFKF